MILNALDSLSEVGVWKTLMRVLRNQKLQIQNYPDSLGFALNISTSSVKPQAFPLDVKVIMIGNTTLALLIQKVTRDCINYCHNMTKISFPYLRSKQNMTPLSSCQMSKLLSSIFR